MASRNQMGLTFGVGLTFKVLSFKWGLLSRVGLTIEWAYYQINKVISNLISTNISLTDGGTGKEMLMELRLRNTHVTSEWRSFKAFSINNKAKNCIVIYYLQNKEH